MGYLIFLLSKILEGILLIIGIPLFLIMYPIRKLIWKYPTLFKFLLLYWFVNNDEKVNGIPDYVSNWYGDLEYRQRKNFNYDTASILQKFLRSYDWVAFRNPHWNFKELIGSIFKTGTDVVDGKEFISTKGNAPNYMWRNKEIHGRQYIHFGGWLLLFRYSFTTKIGNRYINFMVGFGTEKGRIISKLRSFKK